MPVAVIVDLIGFRELGVDKRIEVIGYVRELVNNLYNRFRKYCPVKPAITRDDSIEFVVIDWKPIAFFIHSLLANNIGFKIGLGGFRIDIWGDNADECDGPAFWFARRALESLSECKNFCIKALYESGASTNEVHVLTNIMLYYIIVSSLKTMARIRYCLELIWNKRTVSDIAKLYRVSKASVSKTLSKTPCYILKDIVGVSYTRLLRGNVYKLDQLYLCYQISIR